MDAYYTMTALVDRINFEYKKKTGKQFTVGDIQSYIRRGRLPKYLGDIEVKKSERIKGIKLYKLK